MTDIKEEARLQGQVDKWTAITEKNQIEIVSLIDITAKQSAMIDKQAVMVDKLWGQVKPILENHRRREQLKNELISKILTGGIWAVATGLVLLIWQGIKFYFTFED